MKRALLFIMLLIAVSFNLAWIDASPRLNDDSKALQDDETFNPALNIWIKGDIDQASPALQSIKPMVRSSGNSSKSISVIHSFGFPSGWAYARDLAWDGANLWVGENLYSRINKLDPVSGSVLGYFYAPASNPWGLAWDGTYLHNATITMYHQPPGDTLPDYVYTLTTTGGQVNSWLAPDSPDATPHGAAYDPDAGSLWLSDGYYNMIYETDPSNGNVLTSFAFPGTEPRGMAWCGGHLFVIDNPSLTLYKIDTAGNTVDTVSIASLGNDPEGLTWDGQYFWITENQTDTIYQIDAGMGSLPVPDIKVNGSDGPLYISASDNVTVTIHLDPGDLNGVPADWWVLGEKDQTKTWWAQYRPGLKPKWTKSTTPIRFAGATLRTVNSYTVLGPRTLPLGYYELKFAVDDNKDGIYDASFIDIVEVNVN